MGEVPYHDLLWFVLTVWRVAQAGAVIRYVFQSYQLARCSYTRSPVTYELHKESLHVCEIHQAVVHKGHPVPALQLLQDLVIYQPAAVELVTCFIYGVLIQSRPFAPLQACYLSHDTLTGIEAVQQSCYLLWQVVVFALGDNELTVYRHLPACLPVVGCQHDVGRFPAFPDGEGIQALACIYKTKISSTS